MAPRFHIALFALAAAAAAAPAQAAVVGTPYLYNLSTTTGVLPLHGATLAYDGATKELYVLDGSQVLVFNETGMQVYAFGTTREVGGISSIAPYLDGDLLALSSYEGRMVLLHLDFRGELVERMEPSGVPQEHAGFAASAMCFRDGRIYLANLGSMELLVLDAAGRFEKFFDVAALLQVADKRQDYGIRGFNVDWKGNVLFTVQPLFRAYVLSLDGTLRAFGQRGSAPGKFNIVAGIAADEQGNLYVTDLLKSAVIVFDPEFRFVREFGYRGRKPGNITAPVDIAAGGGKVFVSQYARRGVAVFAVEEQPTPSS
jgi:DNA-binding beta-propeller fold protein YncE